MADINDVLGACFDLDERLNLDTKWDSAIREHLKLMDKKLKYQVPEFQKDLEWMNVAESLTWETHLSGKIVVLDFFTYCCVNCIHVLPDIEALEQAHSVKDGVVVIGVHSAKFLNEKVSSNILSAILRYGIHHPVVNDCDTILWKELQVVCWPTFVIVGPSQQLLFTIIGEGHREKLMEFVRIALEYYKAKGEITDVTLPVQLECDNLGKSALRFPGKVCVSEDGQTVAVADTGHNRILLMDNNGIVQHAIGGPERGLKDGKFSESRFSAPQGMVWRNNTLLVADTDNHSVRQLDFERKTVTTIAGIGKQGQDKDGGKPGTEQEISSPWDLALGAPPGSSDKQVLYIAMAGTHQIWAYFFQTTKWYKGIEYEIGTCVRAAGSGKEENRNNSYPDKAGFAQPSGLALSLHTHVNSLYIADSESSSVRQISLKDFTVKGLVGGDIAPENLFAYGDQDGKGVSAKLQHPLGVSLVTNDAGPLLVADSYNHKIKSVDIKTKECTTLLGSGKAGSAKGDNWSETELNEPGGLWVDQKHGLLYIADTNNHDIKVVDLKEKSLHCLPVIFPEVGASEDTPPQSSEGSGSGVHLSCHLMLEMPNGVHLTEGAPNAWELYSDDAIGKELLQSKKWKGKLTEEKVQHLGDIPVQESLLHDTSQITLYLRCLLYTCDNDNLCKMEEKIVQQEIVLTSGTGSNQISVLFEFQVT